MAVAGNGNNASYAIQQIAIVEVCGFKLNPSGAVDRLAHHRTVRDPQPQQLHVELGHQWRPASSS